VSHRELAAVHTGVVADKPITAPWSAGMAVAVSFFTVAAAGWRARNQMAEPGCVYVERTRGAGLL